MNDTDIKPKDLLFLESCIKFLVDYPEAIKIGRVVDEMGVLLTLDVHPDDMRQVIGREGNTAKAMRTLLRVVGMKSNSRVNLKINEPAGAAPRAPRPMNDDRNDRGDRGFRDNRNDNRNDRGGDRGGNGGYRNDRNDRNDSSDDGYAN